MMSKMNYPILACGTVLFIGVLMTNPVHAVLITDPSDQFTSDIGDYNEVAGVTEAVASSPGQVLEIVGASGGSDLAQTGMEMATLTWGDVQNTLSGSLSSTSLLGFGFSVNQNGPADVLVVTQFDIDLDNDGTVDLSLNSDQIEVTDFNSGTSNAEIRIVADVGFDVFLQDPADELKITVSQTGDNDGFETLFLSEAFTADIPEPVSAAVWLMGLATLQTMVRKRPA